MIKTLYECDMCGKVQEALGPCKVQEVSTQFWDVGVTAKANSSLSNYATFVTPPLQVCRSCLEDMGIHVKESNPKKPLPLTPTTLEDLIVEIVKKTIKE
tara:strand:- start:810 stop:1106 length:297 start_codon:yes stop_codon:yes gene_type:complete